MVFMAVKAVKAVQTAQAVIVIMGAAIQSFLQVPKQPRFPAVDPLPFPQSYLKEPLRMIFLNIFGSDVKYLPEILIGISIN
jgi:hypothetical protein